MDWASTDHTKDSKCIPVKPTKETCLNYNVATINFALKQSRCASLECNLFGDDDFLSTGNDDDDFSDFGPCNTQQETNTYGSDDCALVFPDPVLPLLKHDSPDGACRDSGGELYCREAPTWQGTAIEFHSNREEGVDWSAPPVGEFQIACGKHCVIKCSFEQKTQDAWYEAHGFPLTVALQSDVALVCKTKEPSENQSPEVLAELGPRRNQLVSIGALVFFTPADTFRLSLWQ